ncbi:hypothetical protein BDZ91DRAFT_802957 [Kalaharituber pfeilii]|nr:hypothetical protein BDZ91DRAFT_802957 [Kalaharituber pfeilii]
MPRGQEMTSATLPWEEVNRTLSGNGDGEGGETLSGNGNSQTLSGDRTPSSDGTFEQR